MLKEKGLDFKTFMTNKEFEEFSNDNGKMREIEKLYKNGLLVILKFILY